MQHVASLPAPQPRPAGSASAPSSSAEQQQEPLKSGSPCAASTVSKRRPTASARRRSVFLHSTGDAGAGSQTQPLRRHSDFLLTQRRRKTLHTLLRDVACAVALLFVAQLCSSHNSCLFAAAADDSEVVVPDQQQCIVTLNYGATVGQVPQQADAPVFVGSFSALFNVDPQQQRSQPAGDGNHSASTAAAGQHSSGHNFNNISSWVLGWRFAAGERISRREDVYGSTFSLRNGRRPEQATSIVAAGGNRSLPAPPQEVDSGDGSTNGSSRFEVELVQLQPDGQQAPASLSEDGSAADASSSDQQQGVAVLSESPLHAGLAEATFSFVARKGESSEFSPFRVGPPTGVFFNNLACVQMMVPHSGQRDAAVTNASSGGGSGAPLQPAPPAASAMPVLGDSPLSILQVEYLPIEYRSDLEASSLFATTFTQFYIRLTSVSTDRLVPLDTIRMQYWFDGPDDSLGSDIASWTAGEAGALI